MTTDPADNFASRPFWFKVVEMLQQNWAVIVDDGSRAKAIFFSDASMIFDEIEFESAAAAQAALRRNGFAPYDDDEQAKALIGRPHGPFFRGSHPGGRIYNSGRYWKA